MATETILRQDAKPAGNGQPTAGGTSTVCEDISSAFLRGAAKAKVLLVDDDKLNSFVVAEYMKSDGYRDLIYTTEPFAALRLAYQEHPDVILLDLQMPTLGGLEILRQLRDDQAFDHVAVVILTASRDDKLKTRAMALGATDVLHKSLGRKELLARIRNVLRDQTRKDPVRLI